MELKYDKPVSYEIKLRTFEGRTNPKANNDSLTSKYMPSYKYWMKVVFETRITTDCFRTKKEAYEHYNRLVSLAGKIM